MKLATFLLAGTLFLETLSGGKMPVLDAKYKVKEYSNKKIICSQEAKENLIMDVYLSPKLGEVRSFRTIGSNQYRYIYLTGRQMPILIKDENENGEIDKVEPMEIFFPCDYARRTA